MARLLTPVVTSATRDSKAILSEPRALIGVDWGASCLPSR